VRVVQQILSPGVQHTQEADLRAQMVWIGGDDALGLGLGLGLLGGALATAPYYAAPYYASPGYGYGPADWAHMGNIVGMDHTSTKWLRQVVQ
jgi:hypothetical protein